MQVSFSFDPCNQSDVDTAADILRCLGAEVGAPAFTPVALEVAAPPAPPVPNLADIAAMFPDPLKTPTVADLVKAAQAPAAGEFDRDGYPFDDRIHSSSKAKNADGTWRAKRNLPEGYKQQIEAELRGKATGQAELPVTTEQPVPPPPAPPAPPVLVGGSPVPIVHAPTVEPAAPPAPAAPVAAPPAPPAPAPEPAERPPVATVGDLIVYVSRRLGDKSLGIETLKAILAPHGYTSVPQLMARPDLVAPIHEALEMV